MTTSSQVALDATAPEGGDERAYLRARIAALEAELADLRADAAPAQARDLGVLAEAAGIYAGIIADATGPDRADYRYEQANVAAEAFFGRPLAGALASELGLPADVIGFCLEMARACEATGRAQVKEYRFPAPGREDRWFLGTYGPLPRGADGRLRASFAVTDITLRHAADAALLADETRFRTLAEAAPGIVYESSDAGNLFVNRYYQDYTGLPAEELLGRGWRRVIFPEDLPAVLSEHAAATTTGVPFEMEERIRRHDGAWRWFLFRSVCVRDPAFGGWRRFGIGFDIHARKMAEAALRESEARFRTLADSAPLMIWESDAQGGVTWINRLWLELTGRTLAEEIGDGWTTQIHPDDLARTMATYRDGLARQVPYRMDYRIRRADGAWRTLDETGVPRWAPDGTFLGMIGSCVDVTEARAALSAVALHEETLRLAVEATELGTWDLNLGTHAVTWSARCKAMFGISPRVPVSMLDFYAALHPDDLARVSDVFARAIDPAIRGDFDVEYRTIGIEDGVQRWIAAKGRVLFDARGHGARAVGTTLDITARKQAEARLRASEDALRLAAVGLESRVAERTAQLAESEAQKRAYFESVEDCVFTIAVTEDGRFVHEGYNTHGERRSGFSNAVVRGRPIREFMSPELARGLEASLSSACEQGTQRITARLELPAGEGVFDTLMVPIRDATGRVVRILVASREVTEQIRLEEELRQTQKMQAIGQLTGGVAHDFNNLLTGVIGSLELLGRDVTSERGRRLLDAARRSAERGAQLTTQLLAFSRRQRLQPRAIDLNGLVSGMAGMLHGTLGGAVRVETVLQPDLWPALADATQVELAILNVAINARDAMPAGGAIVVETANVETGPPQTAEDPPAGAHVVVAVRDAGSGISPEVMARVFEPFFTTKEVGRGSGLGLSQVLGVAKQLGGGLRIATRLGEGTTVRIFLPRAAACAAAADLATAGGAPQTLRGVTVLVVDDDADVREVAAALLEELGCAVVTAGSGAAAVELLADGAAIDAALLDYVMPGMNGLETAAQLRAQRPDLPVVFATGYAELAAVQNLQGRVLRKPFGAKDLAAAFGTVLPYRARSPAAD